MELVEQRGSEQWFQYVHGPQYQEVEHQFLAAVESVNPDNILVSVSSGGGGGGSLRSRPWVGRWGTNRVGWSYYCF